jgi:hypothetical protein
VGSLGIGVNGTHPSRASSSSGIAAHVVIKHEELIYPQLQEKTTPTNINTTIHHE